MAKQSSTAIKPLTKSTPATVRRAQKIANSPTVDDVPLSQQPPLKKRLTGKLANI